MASHASQKGHSSLAQTLRPSINLCAMHSWMKDKIHGASWCPSYKLWRSDWHKDMTAALIILGALTRWETRKPWGAHFNCCYNIILYCIVSELTLPFSLLRGSRVLAASQTKQNSVRAHKGDMFRSNITMTWTLVVDCCCLHTGLGMDIKMTCGYKWLGYVLKICRFINQHDWEDLYGH